MKKSVKIFLSAVLTLVLFCRAIAVTSIGVYADTSEPEVGDTYVWFNSPSIDSNGAENDTDVFVVNHTTSTNYLTTTTTVTIGGTNYTVTRKTEASSNDVTIKIPATITSAVLYCVVQSGDSSSKTLSILDSSDNVVKKTTISGSNTYPYITSTSITGLSQGTYFLSASGNYSIGMLALYVEETGEALEENKYDYTISGSVSGLAANVTSFTLTNTLTNAEYTAVVTDDTYTVTENAAISPFKNQTFTAGADGYICDIESFTLGSGTTYADGTVIYTQDLSFTADVVRHTITESAYFDASCLSSNTISDGDIFGTYFEYYSLNSQTASRESTKVSSYGNLDYDYRLYFRGEKRNIKFTIAGDALIQVVFTSNNDKSSRACCIGTAADSSPLCTIYTDSSNASTTPTVINYALTGSETGTDYYIYSPDSGINIYSINIVVGAKLATSSDQIAAYVNGDNSYVLCGVTDDDLEKGNTLTLSGNKAEIDSTNTVYSYVGVDNFVFEASKVINSDASYIYGTQLTGSPSDAGAIIISNVTAEIADK